MGMLQRVYLGWMLSAAAMLNAVPAGRSARRPCRTRRRRRSPLKILENIHRLEIKLGIRSEDGRRASTGTRGNATESNLFVSATAPGRRGSELVFYTYV